MERVITFGELQGSTGFLAEQELRATLAICAGLANKEIARAFGCAPSTVKKSIERAFFKFGVSSRTALVAEAFKRGLISPAAVLAMILAVHASMAEDPALRVRRGSGERRVETRVAVRRIEVALTS